MKLTSEVIENISRIKREPKFMLDFRLKALESFNNCDNPNFGPKLDINYDKITYYKERKGDIHQTGEREAVYHPMFYAAHTW